MSLNLRSFSHIALMLVWFLATNHCLFEVCHTSSAAAAQAATDAPCGGHEHEEQSSHPCGTPCDLESDVSVLGSTAKYLTPPHLEFVSALFVLGNHEPRVLKLAESSPAEPNQAAGRLQHAHLLLDSPNAPPLS